MQSLQPLIPAAHLNGHEDAQGKGQNGQQVVQGGPEPAGEQVGAQQHDVAGLGVGKHLPPAAVGVGVLEAAGDGQERGGDHGL